MGHQIKCSILPNVQASVFKKTIVYMEILFERHLKDSERFNHSLNQF